MKKINYIENTERFWQSRKKSRDAVDKDLAGRSAPKQLAIRDKMLAHHTAMRNAKKVS